MNRRQFVQFMAASSAVALHPFSMASGGSSSKIVKWKKPFEGVNQDFSLQSLKVIGQFPKAVHGAFYRNGPSLQRRGEDTNTHWFDGDGMIQKFSISNQGVSHMGKFVQTPKLIKENQADKFLYSGTGTLRPNLAPIKNSDSINTANTSVIYHHDKFYALWEGGSAIEMDPETLSTKGLKHWQNDLKHMPFSAHPLTDSDGSLWNIGSASFAGPLVALYHIAPDGKLLKSKLVKLDFAGYMHAFTQTPKHIILLNNSSVFQQGKTFVESFKWSPELASQAIVIDKNTLDVVQTFELPASFVFHFGNGFESGNALHFYACRYENDAVMTQAMSDLFNESGSITDSNAILTQVTLDLSTKKTQIKDLGQNLEFPSFDVDRLYAQQDLFGLSSTGKSHPMLNTLVRFDTKTGKSEQFTFNDHTILEEPLYIKDKENTNKEYMLLSFYDFEAQQSGIAVFEGNGISNGPLGVATMDRVVPLGFHGTFIKS